MTKFTDADVVVGRVLNEDDRFITLEIAKDTDHEKLRVEEGDRFFTLLFTNGKPWEK